LEFPDVLIILGWVEGKEAYIKLGSMNGVQMGQKGRAL
jgi:hypothetical protein